MVESTDQRPYLKRKANEILSGLSHEERESLLIKCWMSHDARWFMAVAQAFGIETANRLNQAAAHEEGKIEARRIIRALRLAPAATADDCLLTQEIIIGLVGPELLDYEAVKSSDGRVEVCVRRCFAHENVTRAGIAGAYECGIFARVSGWIEALGLRYEMTPSLGTCAKAQGRECVYAFTVQGGGAPAGS